MVTFQWIDIIDVVLVAFLMYKCYIWTGGTGAKNIFIGLIIFLLMWFFVTQIFKMKLLGSIFNGIFNVGGVALIVIFQAEIRRFFSRIGSRNNWKHFRSFLEKLHFLKPNEQSALPIKNIADACRNMSKNKIGALIVIVKSANLQDCIDTGEVINAEINTRLIENIFFKNSPLHDGALIVADNKIVAAGAILPISRNPDIPKNLGLRHRAALGIAERTDAVTIIVSEETGNISIAAHSAYVLDIEPNELENIILEKLK
ncbi:MAG: diadenylate cyclase CdaA [Prevotellaceae bacterium]|jgi:uncharacterized protein (TIGR00159 family)|nr:diadenylate cyclase CdaA [Prevotellaceae bacterium]